MSLSGSCEVDVVLELVNYELPQKLTTGIALWRRLQGPSGPVSLVAFGLAGVDLKRLLSDEQIKMIEHRIDQEDKARERRQ
jgi:hypothetical protein